MSEARGSVKKESCQVSSHLARLDAKAKYQGISKHGISRRSWKQFITLIYSVLASRAVDENKWVICSLCLYWYSLFIHRSTASSS